MRKKVLFNSASMASPTFATSISVPVTRSPWVGAAQSTITKEWQPSTATMVMLCGVFGGCIPVFFKFLGTSSSRLSTWK